MSLQVKAERLKSRAQEKYTNKLASTRRIAEEKRASAEAKLNEKAVKTSEKADYIRRLHSLAGCTTYSLVLKPENCSVYLYFKIIFVPVIIYCQFFSNLNLYDIYIM